MFKSRKHMWTSMTSQLIRTKQKEKEKKKKKLGESEYSKACGEFPTFIYFPFFPAIEHTTLLDLKLKLQSISEHHGKPGQQLQGEQLPPSGV